MIWANRSSVRGLFRLALSLYRILVTNDEGILFFFANSPSYNRPESPALVSNAVKKIIENGHLNQNLIGFSSFWRSGIVFYFHFLEKIS